MKLSDSQRKFCQLVVDGVSHTEAYMQSYDKCTSRKDAARSRSQRVANTRSKQGNTRKQNKPK